MDPIFTSYVVGITTNAVFEAAIRIKEARDGRRAEAERDLASRRELFENFTNFVLPKLDEIFADFTVNKDLHDFLLSQTASEALKAELLRQADDQSWSSESALAALSVQEGFELMPELEAFVERLIRAIQRSMAEDQSRFNEAIARAAANLLSGQGRIEAELREMKGMFHSFLQEQSGERPPSDLNALGSKRPHIELARFGEKYKRDYEFLSQLLDEGRLDQAELYGTKLISDIEVDHNHLRPHFKAAVLTLRAHARLRQNQIEESDSDFRAAYDSHYDDVSGVNFAASLMRQGLWDDALPISKRLLESFPEDFRVRVICASLISQNSPSENVESILNEVRPVTADDFVLLAEFRFGQNDFDQAVDAARNALKLDPDDLYAKFYLAHGLAFDLITSPRWAFHTEEQQRIREAAQLLSDVRKVLESEKQLFSLETVYINLGVLYLKLGDNAAAMEVFDAGLALFPKSEALMVRQWRVLTVAKDVGRAATIARQLHVMIPSCESAARVPMTYAMNGDFTLAESALVEVIGESDYLLDDPDFTILRCHILTHSEPPRYQEALDLLGKSLLENPGYADLWVIRAEVHQSIGDKANAIQDLKTALKTDPNDLVIRGAADIFTHLKEWKQAHTLLKTRKIDAFDDPHLFRAVEMAIFADDFPEAWRLLGLVSDSDPIRLKFEGQKADLLVRESRFDEAETLLGEILLEGELAELARMNLAGVLLDFGQSDRSLQLLTPCLPDFQFIDTAVLGAETLARLNRPDEAVRTAISAIDLEFDNTAALQVFVLCYEQKINAGGVLTPADDLKFEAAKLRLAELDRKQKHT